jgi:uncharacterized ion transporter superfamily protein YfcC
MRRFAFPHPFVLLVGGILLAAVLTWMVPAGRYDRRDDPVTGRKVVVAGTYHAVPPAPVGPFQAFVNIPKGLINAADVVFFVFLAGGAFTVVDRTGALRWAVDWLAVKLRDRRGWVIPLTCAVFALGGALENLQEEIIAMIPVLLILCRRLGFDPLTAAGMSIGAASVGSAFSPVNPFQAVLAQQLAELPKLSAASYRMAFLLPALGIWTWGVHRHASRTRRTEPAAEEEKPGEPLAPPGTAAATATAKSEARLALILATVGISFAFFVYGVVVYHWGFEEMAAVFFLMGLASGLIGKLGLGGIADAFIEGFRSMAFAALLIGFARGILVVLESGQIIDTIVLALFTPLARLPVALSAAGMMGVQTLLHFPVPSVGGQAQLTLPVLVPLADLLGLSRQTVVLAYQYGAGLCELLTPTNGALMAILGAVGVRYEDWLRFALPLYAALAALGLCAVVLGAVIGLR